MLGNILGNCSQDKGKLLISVFIPFQQNAEMNEEHQSLSLVESAASSTWYPQSSSSCYPQVFHRQMALPAAPTRSRHHGYHGNRTRPREDECTQCTRGTAPRCQCYQTTCCGNSCSISMDGSCENWLQNRSVQGGCTQNYTEYTDCVQNTCTQTHYIDQYCSSNSSTPRRTPLYLSSTSSIPSVCPPVFPQCTITELPDDSSSPCQPESPGQSETSTQNSSLSPTNENSEPVFEGANDISGNDFDITNHRSEAYQVETNEGPEPHFENTNESSDSEESPITDIASLFTECREEESVQSNSTLQVSQGNETGASDPQRDNVQSSSTSQTELSQHSETSTGDPQRDGELVRGEVSDLGKDLVDPGAINLSFIEEDAITISTREISAIASAGFGRSSGISTMNSNQTQDGSVQQTSRTRETVNVIDNDARIADQSQMISQGYTNNGSDTHHLEDQNMDSSVVLGSQTSNQNMHRHHTLTSPQCESQSQTTQTTCGCSANRCHSHSVNSNTQIARRCRHSQHVPPISQPQGCHHRQHRPHSHSQRPPDHLACECTHTHQGPLNPRPSIQRHSVTHPHQQHRHRSSPHRHPRDSHSSRRQSRQYHDHHHCNCSTSGHDHRHAQSQSRTHRRSPYRRAGRTATIMPLSAWNLRQFERSLPSEPPPPYMQWQLPPYMEQEPPPSYRSRATTPAHSLYQVDATS